MEMKTVVRLIKGLPQKSAPYVIAIDGFGGSGKSTIASRLSEYLPISTIVTMDDFIDDTHFYDDNWEHAFKRDEVKSKVIALTKSSNATYIIVEGISSMHPLLATLYDFTIWVDAPIDVAKSRGQLRDKGNENEGRWDSWAENDLKYLKDYNPKDRAAVIINANNSSH